MNKEPNDKKEKFTGDTSPLEAPPFIQKYGKQLSLLGILALTFFLYLPSLSGDFITTWDDQLYVTENPLVSKLTPQNIQKIFTTNVAGNYHPLTVLSMAMNYQLSGENPFAFRLTNLLLHLLNTLLVFSFVSLLTGRKWIVAAFTALLFGIHPMHVESVAWIAERKDVLHTFFYLLAAIAYLLYLQKGKIWYYPVAFVLFVLAILSKGTAVSLVGVMVLIDYFLKRKFTWQLIADKLPFVAIAVYFGMMAVGAQAEHDIVTGLGKFYSFKRLAFAGYGFVMYIVKLFVPVHLSALYPYPSLAEGMPLFLKSAPFIALTIMVLTAISMRFTRIIAFGVGFYLVTVVLVLQYIQVGAAIMADRYTYIPYIGLFFILGYGIDLILKKENPSLKWIKYGVGSVTVLYILFCAYSTFERSKVWQNGENLWSDVIENFPGSAMAHNNRGNHYLNVSKEPEKALADYSRAIQLKPSFTDAHTNRGNYYYKKKEFRKALADYERVIGLKADHYSAYNNRGGVHFALGDYAKAIQDYTKVIELNPKHYKAYNNMGACYSQLGQQERAIESFNKCLQLNPKMGVAYLYRSYAWNSLGQNDKALQDARKAKRMGVKVQQDYLESLK